MIHPDPFFWRGARIALAFSVLAWAAILFFARKFL